MSNDLAVRKLAEFTCSSGDLYARKPGRQIDAEQGIAAQVAVQAQRIERDPQYQREVSVKTKFEWASTSTWLKGRMDGLYNAQSKPIIEEFKCCAELPARADSLDLGQLRIYAGMLAFTRDKHETLELRLIYVQADSLTEAVFSYTLTAAHARADLALMLLCYAVRMQQHDQRNAARVQWSAQLRFPLPQYRPSQKAIARRVFKAIKQRENLLLEAPTGSGKTLGVLYPAVRAQAAPDQIFFLTSRHAGAFSAMAAIDQLDPEHAQICVVELNAKEKMCFVPGMPCDPERCTYAAGYYDRVGAAVNELIQTKYISRMQIEMAAQRHHVCPFELSLDTATWADIICGDYNYVFDPVVRLKRFTGHSNLHLLVDEAHQLSARACDMLSARLTRDEVRQARMVDYPGCKKIVGSIDRALLKARRPYGEGEHRLACVKSLARACQKMLDWVAMEGLELDQHGELVPLYFAVTRWMRSESWLHQDAFAHVILSAGTDIEVRRICLDPAAYLSDRFAEHAGVVRFSGTVSPLPLYQRLHGQICAPQERAESPFSADQALVMVVPDIPTYFKQRHSSLTLLVNTISALVSVKPGRYLVALPSFAYLRALAAVADVIQWGEVFEQAPGQDTQATLALLNRFCGADQGVLLIVSGGIYGESVDFAGANLRGVVVVGLGLPPPSLHRSLMENYFDEHQGEGWGQMVAYTQPALVKNIQAAGRLIRSQADFGVICLIDPRFRSVSVQRFFPSHWRAQNTLSCEVEDTVTQFWRHKGDSDLK